MGIRKDLSTIVLALAPTISSGCLAPLADLLVGDYSVTDSDNGTFIDESESVLINVDAYTSYDPIESYSDFTGQFIVNPTLNTEMVFDLQRGETRKNSSFFGASYYTEFSVTISPNTFSVGDHDYNFFLTDNGITAQLNYESGPTFTIHESEYTGETGIDTGDSGIDTGETGIEDTHPVINSVIFTPEYASNLETVLMQAAVTDDRGISSVTATVQDVGYTLIYSGGTYNAT
ncbi:MAG: hypothetical protein WC254_04335, partial [Candidatus Woesearchaeota archaeon]